MEWVWGASGLDLDHAQFERFVRHLKKGVEQRVEETRLEFRRDIEARGISVDISGI